MQKYVSTDSKVQKIHTL